MRSSLRVRRNMVLMSESMARFERMTPSFWAAVTLTTSSWLLASPSSSLRKMSSRLFRLSTSSVRPFSLGPTTDTSACSAWLRAFTNSGFSSTLMRSSLASVTCQSWMMAEARPAVLRSVRPLRRTVSDWMAHAFSCSLTSPLMTPGCQPIFCTVRMTSSRYLSWSNISSSFGMAILHFWSPISRRASLALTGLARSFTNLGHGLRSPRTQAARARATRSATANGRFAKSFMSCPLWGGCTSAPL